MNKRRMSDREWVEWVSKGPKPPLSPYGKDDVWMVDRPEEGTCLFAAREGRGIELVLMMRGDGYESRLAVPLDLEDMRTLRSFLADRIEDIAPKRAQLSEEQGREEAVEMRNLPPENQ